VQSRSWNVAQPLDDPGRNLPSCWTSMRRRFPPTSSAKRTDLGYIPSLFDQWVRAAQAPAIESTLRLFQKARQLQVAVFFISARREALRAATQQNLQTQGYAGWSGLVLRPMEDNSRSTAEFKSSARQRVADQGYRIIVNVGDQVSDLSGEPAAELSVKLPNPFYFIP